MSEQIYQEAIKRLAQAAHGQGRLEDADGSAQLDNPLCGDRVRVEVRRAHGTVAALAHETRGCLLCRAAAALVGQLAPGRGAAELQAAAEGARRFLAEGAAAPAGWEALEAFLPVRSHRSRHGCVLLPFQALAAALAAPRRD